MPPSPSPSLLSYVPPLRDPLDPNDQIRLASETRLPSPWMVPRASHSWRKREYTVLSLCSNLHPSPCSAVAVPLRQTTISPSPRVDHVPARRCKCFFGRKPPLLATPLVPVLKPLSSFPSFPDRFRLMCSCARVVFDAGYYIFSPVLLVSFPLLPLPLPFLVITPFSFRPEISIFGKRILLFSPIS